LSGHRLPLLRWTIHFPSNQSQLIGRGKSKEPQRGQVPCSPYTVRHCGIDTSTVWDTGYSNALTALCGSVSGERYSTLAWSDRTAPDCIHFSCCSPTASTSAAVPQLRPFQLLLFECVHLFNISTKYNKN